MPRRDDRAMNLVIIHSAAKVNQLNGARLWQVPIRRHSLQNTNITSHRSVPLPHEYHLLYKRKVSFLIGNKDIPSYSELLFGQKIRGVCFQASSLYEPVVYHAYLHSTVK